MAKLKKVKIELNKNFSLILFLLNAILSKVPLKRTTSQKFQFKINDLKLSHRDRVLVLVPHPDDEILGTGGLLQKLVSKKILFKLVFLTHGDNNHWSFIAYKKIPLLTPSIIRKMGLIRSEEVLSSCKILGVPKENIIFLGYPDFGTLKIWRNHWGETSPFRNIFTNSNHVFYKNSFRIGAKYKGEEILHDLKSIIGEFKPTKIFLSHPSDQNPDHQALYLFCSIALWDLEKQIKPELYPYLIHFKGWPKPKKYFPSDPLLPPPIYSEEIEWSVLRLQKKEIEKKMLALQEHKTQLSSTFYNLIPSYLFSFIRKNELFGDLKRIVIKRNSNFVRIFPTFAPFKRSTKRKSPFIGIENVYVRLEKRSISFLIEISKPLTTGVEVSLHVFGYKKSKCFSKMPKLSFWIGEVSRKCYDGKIPLKIGEISANSKNIFITIPLKSLQNPEKLIVSARTYLRAVPLDWAYWRIVELERFNH